MISGRRTVSVFRFPPVIWSFPSDGGERFGSDWFCADSPCLSALQLPSDGGDFPLSKHPWRNESVIIKMGWMDEFVCVGWFWPTFAAGLPQRTWLCFPRGFAPSGLLKQKAVPVNRAICSPSSTFHSTGYRNKKTWSCFTTRFPHFIIHIFVFDSLLPFISDLARPAY